MEKVPVAVGFLAIIFAFIPGVQFREWRYGKQISKLQGRLWFVGIGLLFIVAGIFGRW